MPTWTDRELGFRSPLKCRFLGGRLNHSQAGRVAATPVRTGIRSIGAASPARIPSCWQPRRERGHAALRARRRQIATVFLRFCAKKRPFPRARGRNPITIDKRYLSIVMATENAFPSNGTDLFIHFLFSHFALSFSISFKLSSDVRAGLTSRSPAEAGNGPSAFRSSGPWDQMRRINGKSRSRDLSP